MPNVITKVTDITLGTDNSNGFDLEKIILRMSQFVLTREREREPIELTYQKTVVTAAKSRVTGRMAGQWQIDVISGNNLPSSQNEELVNVAYNPALSGLDGYGLTKTVLLQTSVMYRLNDAKKDGFS